VKCQSPEELPHASQINYPIIYQNQAFFTFSGYISFVYSFITLYPFLFTYKNFDPIKART
jgi:hypothetical protein